MRGKIPLRGVLAASIVASAVAAQAVTIDLVPVGNAGNASRYSVSIERLWRGGLQFRIGKYEVTAGQYCDFLNAVAPGRRLRAVQH